MSFRLLAVSALAVVAAVLWAWRVRGLRRRMRRLASELGATFCSADRDDLGRRLGELALWQYGHSHELSDELKGVHDSTEFYCFTDNFDVGFGRDRVRHAHVVVVVPTGRRHAELVCVRRAFFTPCGPHAQYEPAWGTAARLANPAESDDWQVWCRPADSAAAVWERLGPVCEGLEGPCLIETQGDLVAVCHPGGSDPDQYRRTIELGLRVVRALEE